MDDCSNQTSCGLEVRMRQALSSGFQWTKFYEGSRVYRQCLDDVLVFARTFQDGCDRMDAVFSRIQEAGLKLKPSKCEFGTTEVNYFGFKVSDKGKVEK